MTASNLACTDLILWDNWPCPIMELKSPPTGGFDGDATGVTVPAQNLGTKLCGFDEITEGWATFIYCKNVESDTTTTLTVGQILSPNGTYLFRVDQDTANVATAIGPSHGLIAVALKAMTANQYGWFWCGGVCYQDTSWGTSALSSTSVLTVVDTIAGTSVGLMLADGTAKIGLNAWTGDLLPVGTALGADA